MRTLWRTLRIVLIGLALVLTACGGTAEQTPGSIETTETPQTTGPTETASESPGGTTTPTDGDATEAAGCEQYEIESQVSDNVLLVDAPVPDAEFPPGSVVSGCTNAFEASFQWEVLGADGETLASGHETASCGSGCLGIFEFTVDYEVDSAQEGTVRLFVESAKDGSLQMEDEVQVQLTS